MAETAAKYKLSLLALMDDLVAVKIKTPASLLQFFASRKVKLLVTVREVNAELLNRTYLCVCLSVCVSICLRVCK